jgi:acetyl esterase
MLLKDAPRADKALAIGLIDRNRQLLERATRHPYAVQDSCELAVHLFLPDDWRKEDRRPGFVFLHSSQWDHGNITQFAPHALFFASRGAVCALAEYRTAGTGTPLSERAPLEGMADARSAIRWTRANAGALGIDSEKLIGAGGSCGAHGLVAAGMCDEQFDDPNDDTNVSCRPDALVLFSPVLDTSKKGVGLAAFPDAGTAKAASPLAQIRPGQPPMIVFHGGADQSVPIAGVRKFAKKMQRKKNVCELVEFGGERHSFFNFNVNDRLYSATVEAAANFLVEQGLLEIGEDGEARF